MDSETFARLQCLKAWRLSLEAESEQLTAYIRDTNIRIERILQLFREWSQLMEHAFAAATEGSPAWDRCQDELCEIKQRMVAYQKG